MGEHAGEGERRLNMLAAVATIVATLLALWQWKGLEVLDWIEAHPAHAASHALEVPGPDRNKPVIASGAHQVTLVDAGRLTDLSDAVAFGVATAALASVDYNEAEPAGCGNTCVASEVEHRFIAKFGLLLAGRSLGLVFVESRPDGSHCTNCASTPRTHLSVFEMERVAAEWRIVRSAISAITLDEPASDPAFLREHLHVEPFGDDQYALVFEGIDHESRGTGRFISILAWNGEELATVFAQSIREVAALNCAPDGIAIATDVSSTVELVEYPAMYPEIVVTTNIRRAGEERRTRSVYAFSGGQYSRVDLGPEPGAASQPPDPLPVECPVLAQPIAPQEETNHG